MLRYIAEDFSGIFTDDNLNIFDLNETQNALKFTWIVFNSVKCSILIWTELEALVWRQ